MIEKRERIEKHQHLRRFSLIVIRVMEKNMVKQDSIFNELSNAATSVKLALMVMDINEKSRDQVKNL